MTPRRPPLRFHGGKWRIAPWIISSFPDHRVYVEPFGGGASVLVRKPRSWAEVYNDCDGDVVNFFQVLRDQPAKLLEALALTPFARDEFELSYDDCDDPMERARRTVVRSFMGHSSASITRGHHTGFRANSFGSHRHAANDWINLPAALELVAERFMGVVIENTDAAEVMKRFDKPDTLHYVDPPYPKNTRQIGGRGYGKCYANELTDEDHRDLAEVLRGLEGFVVLSGYPCELYDEELYADWSRTTIETRGSGGQGSVERTEVLWLSPRCAEAQRQGSLFDSTLRSEP